ncbi:hypothetical protein CesoFtcFv8_025708 [Champsocephalus esox]|uniref:Uncharacterized protein n=1 Tax=Champsocephalus esox TaxID=159716 RepID=A0AAN8B0V2_9TELE|nr:hypothetical protein CesoFtcFv8_025708 [Champsocephalus esox]
MEPYKFGEGFPASVKQRWQLTDAGHRSDVVIKAVMLCSSESSPEYAFGGAEELPLTAGLHDRQFNLKESGGLQGI